MAEKVPGWLERLLLPKLSSIEGDLKELRGEVRGDIGELRGDFRALSSKVEEMDRRISGEIASMDKRLSGEIASMRSELQYAPKVAVIEARLTELERKVAAR